MKSGFDANVPKRKPRTRLGAMLADLDAAASELPKPANSSEVPSAITPSEVPELGAADLDAALAEAGLMVIDPAPHAAALEEAAKAEAARIEAARIETAKAEAARIEAARIEAANAEAARLEAVRLEAERERAAQREAERAEASRLEAIRIDQARDQQARLDLLRDEAKRIRAARIEAAPEPAPKVEPSKIAGATFPVEATPGDAASQRPSRIEAAISEAARIRAAHMDGWRLDSEWSERPEGAQVAAETPEATRSGSLVKPARPAPELDAGGATVKTGRARIAELRARLDAANKRREESPPEPQITATRVRETVATLSHRLEQTQVERAEVVATLEATRKELATTQELLEKESRSRAAAEAAAAERKAVADDLLLESEALARERDRAIACIGDMKDLDAQQAALLQQMAASVADRDRTIDRLQAQNLELRSAVDVAASEAEAVQARLQLALSDRTALEARIAQLEAELSRTHSAHLALGEIHKLVDAVK